MTNPKPLDIVTDVEHFTDGSVLRPATDTEAITMVEPEHLGRPERRRLERKIEAAAKQLLSTRSRHSDIRVLPCADPDHPVHVYIFNEHMTPPSWIKCDDHMPLAADVLRHVTVSIDGSDEEE